MDGESSEPAEMWHAYSNKWVSDWEWNEVDGDKQVDDSKDEVERYFIIICNEDEVGGRTR